MAPKRFAPKRVGQMDFDERPVKRAAGIEDRDGGMAEAGRIEDDAAGPGPGLLQPVDEGALVVALTELDREPMGRRMADDGGVDIRQRVPAVNFRLAAAQEIEIR